MKTFFNQLLALAVVSWSTIANATPLEERQVSGFGQRPIFFPAANYRTPKVMYARTATLQDGSMLATWENYSPEPPKVFFPIYKSSNNGASWAPLSQVDDQKNGWGLRYQPTLYVLPQPWAGFAAGTVLLAGNSIPSDLSQTRIDLYASQDSGLTWSFVSNIVAGGAANTDNGQTPVWEPFLLLHNGQLIAYYSDQGDKAYGQKLAHRACTDGRTWSAAVNDVTSPVYTERPGMATVAQLPNGQWIMTYELGSGVPYRYPVYYKIASDPTKFGTVAGVQLLTKDIVPDGNPVVTWSPVGGPNGTILVTAGGNNEIFINAALGSESQWTIRGVPIAAGYSREVRAIDTKGSVMITGAGPLGGDNWVSNAIINLQELPNRAED